MNLFYEGAINNLSNESIHTLYEDVTFRIGSHVAGGDPDSNYIKKQQDILSICQDELQKRSSK